MREDHGAVARLRCAAAVMQWLFPLCGCFSLVSPVHGNTTGLNCIREGSTDGRGID